MKAEQERVHDAFRCCIDDKCKDCPWLECDKHNNPMVEVPRDLALAVARTIMELGEYNDQLKTIVDYAGSIGLLRDR